MGCASCHRSGGLTRKILEHDGVTGHDMVLEHPPGFIVRTEAQKAASANGFRLPRGIEHGWLGFASTTARVMVWIARESKGGTWLLSVDRPEVTAELRLSPAPDIVGPGAARRISYDHRD
jgi:hypothetical protein